MSKSMNIAVTGGSGMVGSRIVDRLIGQGHRVTVIDRTKPKPQKPQTQLKAEFVWADLLRRETFGASLRGMDAVAHLGEAPNARMVPGADTLYIHNTTIGASVMQAAADADVKRLVYASTSQVYGFWGTARFPADLIPSAWPMPEDQVPRPLNAYALSKFTNEQFARLVSEQSSMSVAVIRFPAVVDPQSHWAGSLVNQLGNHPSEGFYVQVLIDSLADAWCRALTLELPGQFNTYHVCSPDVVGPAPIRDRLSRFYAQLPSLPADWPAYASPVSTLRAQRDLGWEPVSLRNALHGAGDGAMTAMAHDSQSEAGRPASGR